MGYLNDGAIIENYMGEMNPVGNGKIGYEYVKKEMLCIPL